MKEGDSRYGVYLAYRPALIDYATPILGSRESAEDVVQEAFIKFVPASSHAGNAGQPVAYLYRMVRNLALDLLRRRKLESRQHAHDTPYWAMPRAEATPEQSALFCDEVRRISAILTAMPAQTRIAVEMHRFGGYKLEEVAAHLGVSVATAHRMIHAALVEIAQQLGRDRT